MKNTFNFVYRFRSFFLGMLIAFLVGLGFAIQWNPYKAAATAQLLDSGIAEIGKITSSTKNVETTATTTQVDTSSDFGRLQFGLLRQQEANSAALIEIQNNFAELQGMLNETLVWVMSVEYFDYCALRAGDSETSTWERFIRADYAAGRISADSATFERFIENVCFFDDFNEFPIALEGGFADEHSYGWDYQIFAPVVLHLDAIGNEVAYQAHNMFELMREHVVAVIGFGLLVIALFLYLLLINGQRREARQRELEMREMLDEILGGMDETQDAILLQLQELFANQAEIFAAIQSMRANVRGIHKAVVRVEPKGNQREKNAHRKSSGKRKR